MSDVGVRVYVCVSHTGVRVGEGGVKKGVMKRKPFQVCVKAYYSSLDSWNFT